MAGSSKGNVVSTLDSDATSGQMSGIGLPRSTTRTVRFAPPVEAGLEPSVSTVVTAEIPAVAPHRSYGVLLPDGTIWYPDSKRRLPAPVAMRIAVWTLAFFFAVFVAGYIIETVRPSWLAPLRRTIGTVSLTTGQKPPSSKGATTTIHHGASVFKVLSNVGTTTTYQVPDQTYGIEVQTTQAAWVVVKSPANAKADLVEQVLPAHTTQHELVTGSSSVYVAAGGTKIEITANGKSLSGAILPVVGRTYVFQPAAT